MATRAAGRRGRRGRPCPGRRGSGELTERASTAGSQGRTNSSVSRQSSKLAIPTWTWRPQTSCAWRRAAPRAARDSAARARSPALRSRERVPARRGDAGSPSRSAAASRPRPQPVELGEDLVRVAADRRVRLDEAGEELGLQRRAARERAARLRAPPRSVSASRSISSSSTPARAGRCPRYFRPNAVHGPAGGLPGVVRGARAERLLVRDDARVAADLHRALRRARAGSGRRAPPRRARDAPPS